MFYYENLEDVIFNLHETLPDKPDELIIISGFLSPAPIKRLANLPFKTKVIGGMYSKGINSRLLASLKKAQNDDPSLTIAFTSTEIHSKIYLWKKNNEILAMLIGSANFSSKGLRTDFRETLAKSNSDSFSMMDSYLAFIEKNSINEPEILSSASLLNQQMIAQSLTTELSCDIPLFDPRRNTVPESSGLNWGMSTGHVALGDAEIRIRSTVINQNQGVITPFDPTYVHTKKGRPRNSDPVELIWDDGTVMPASFEGIGTRFNGNIYPKQIASYSPFRPTLPDGTQISVKSILGRYLRDRLGVDLNHLITMEDLQRYGRTSITLSLIEDGLYYCDFSI